MRCDRQEGGSFMKKTLAIALSMSMAAGLMTGCGSKPAETNATTAAPQAAETGKTEASETTKAQNTAEKEPVELCLCVIKK